MRAVITVFVQNTTDVKRAVMLEVAYVRFVGYRFILVILDRNQFHLLNIKIYARNFIHS